MSLATRHEIEYLQARDGQFSDPRLIDELEERLDALRNLDQFVDASDWCPHARDAHWEPKSPYHTA